MGGDSVMWLRPDAARAGMWDSFASPDDYKIFCFRGEPRAMFVATGRGSGDTRFDFFDTDFRHLPFTNGHPNADVMPSRPENLDEMLDMARILSRGMAHVRVDFYSVRGKTYFGEMTFYHWGGLVPFEPEEWDERFGSWLNLPEGRGGERSLV